MKVMSNNDSLCSFLEKEMADDVFKVVVTFGFCAQRNTICRSISRTGVRTTRRSKIWHVVDQHKP